MSITAIVQARLSSSRLPRKVLMPVLGRPLLSFELERIKRSQHISHFILATSTSEEDRQLEPLAKEYGFSFFQGSLEDVLDRLYQASQLHPSDHIVRLTGDCPLIDPQVIDQTIQYHIDGRYDYTSNCLEPTFPDGLDVEVIKSTALQAAWKKADLTSEREHVTPYIYKHSDLFKIGKYKNDTDLSALRWTVDEPQDFEFVSHIIKSLYPQNQNFDFATVLDFLDKNQSISKMNSNIKRNEGYETSLKKDQKNK